MRQQKSNPHPNALPFYLWTSTVPHRQPQPAKLRHAPDGGGVKAPGAPTSGRRQPETPPEICSWTPLVTPPLPMISFHAQSLVPWLQRPGIKNMAFTKRLLILWRIFWTAVSWRFRKKCETGKLRSRERYLTIRPKKWQNKKKLKSYGFLSMWSKFSEIYKRESCLRIPYSIFSKYLAIFLRNSNARLLVERFLRVAAWPWELSWTDPTGHWLLEKTTVPFGQYSIECVSVICVPHLTAMAQQEMLPVLSPQSSVGIQCRAACDKSAFRLPVPTVCTSCSAVAGCWHRAPLHCVPGTAYRPRRKLHDTASVRW